MVVDDVAEIQRLIHQWLRELGCVVTCVSTGKEAVRILRTIHVDVVITDILMPDGDGLEVISEIRKAQPSARVIAMSGGGNHLRATDCLKLAKGLGAHAILMKPFKREQLVDAVSAQLSPGGQTAPA